MQPFKKTNIFTGLTTYVGGFKTFIVNSDLFSHWKVIFNNKNLKTGSV